ncbi:hypothetical protein [Chelonobacter oris]|uniref:PFGI-1 class ICE element type IV pilus protein PilL2 n=1 Tax=Chelonobacter oris TaxID=505317 RepID=UPI003133958A
MLLSCFLLQIQKQLIIQLCASILHSSPVNTTMELMMNKIVSVSLLSLFITACAQTLDAQPDTQTTESPQTFPLPATPVLDGAKANKGFTVTELPDSFVLPPVAQARPISPDIYNSHSTTQADIIRQGCYTLVSISPEEGQKYLLEQMVTVKVPVKNKRYTANVEAGLKTALINSGLTLCHSGFGMNDVTTLYSRPLPKIHYQFGPMKLGEALQMLAGPAYEVTLNDITRTVCFATRVEPAYKMVAPIMMTTTTTTTEIMDEEE